MQKNAHADAFLLLRSFFFFSENTECAKGME